MVMWYLIENVMFVIIIFYRCVIYFCKGYCVGCFFVKIWSIEKSIRKKSLFIVIVFLDFVILDLGNVNFINKINF